MESFAAQVITFSAFQLGRFQGKRGSTSTSRVPSGWMRAKNCSWAAAAKGMVLSIIIRHKLDRKDRVALQTNCLQITFILHSAGCGLRPPKSKLVCTEVVVDWHNGQRGLASPCRVSARQCRRR